MPRIQNTIDFDGAIITVRIELMRSRGGLPSSHGPAVPLPFATTALIDPGASHTAVHPMILDHLGAVPDWGSLGRACRARMSRVGISTM